MVHDTYKTDVAWDLEKKKRKKSSPGEKKSGKGLHVELEGAVSGIDTMSISGSA